MVTLWVRLTRAHSPFEDARRSSTFPPVLPSPASRPPQAKFGYDMGMGNAVWFPLVIVIFGAFQIANMVFITATNLGITAYIQVGSLRLNE